MNDPGKKLGLFIYGTASFDRKKIADTVAASGVELLANLNVDSARWGMLYRPLTRELLIDANNTKMLISFFPFPPISKSSKCVVKPLEQRLLEEEKLKEKNAKIFEDFCQVLSTHEPQKIMNFFRLYNEGELLQAKLLHQRITHKDKISYRPLDILHNFSDHIEDKHELEKVIDIILLCVEKLARDDESKVICVYAYFPMIDIVIESNASEHTKEKFDLNVANKCLKYAENLLSKCDKVFRKTDWDAKNVEMRLKEKYLKISSLDVSAIHSATSSARPWCSII